MRKHSSTGSSSSSESRSHSSTNEGTSTVASSFGFFPDVFPPSDPLSWQEEASEDEDSDSLEVDFASCLSESFAPDFFFCDEELLLLLPCLWLDDRLDELW